MGECPDAIRRTCQPHLMNATVIHALHDWPFAVWLRSAPIVYPALETLHIIAIAIAFGSLWIVDLRLLGVRLFGLGALDVRTLAGAALPWTLFGFVLAAAAGSLMFLARAGDFIGNQAFLLKILLLFVAGTNAAILHSRGPLDSSSTATRLQAAFSLLIWIAIIICGRWIAYV